MAGLVVERREPSIRRSRMSRTPPLKRRSSYPWRDWAERGFMTFADFAENAGGRAAGRPWKGVLAVAVASSGFAGVPVSPGPGRARCLNTEEPG